MKYEINDSNFLLVKDKIDNLYNKNFLKHFSVWQKFETIMINESSHKDVLFTRIMKLDCSFNASLDANSVFGITIDYTNNVQSKYYCKICEKFSASYQNGLCPHIGCLIKSFNNKCLEVICDDDKIEQKFIDSEKKNKEKLRLKEIKNKLKVISEMSSILKDELVFDVAEHIHLLPVISVENIDNEVHSIYYLSLKVGNSRFYVVKNIYEFLGYVINKNSFSYGKGLVFNHRIENFDDVSQKLIDLLIANNYHLSDYGGKRIQINSAQVESILKIYQNNYVTIDKDDTLIESYASLDPLNISIIIENNVLKIKNFKKSDLLLEGFINDYIVSNNIIYILNSSFDKREFAKMIIRNGEFDFTEVKEQFFNEVFLKCASNIISDLEFRKDHGFSELVIKSYFDLVSDCIICDTKYYLVNEVEREVSLVELENSVTDLSKLVKYNEMLSANGFVDGKISDIEKIAEFLTSDLSKLQKVATIYLSDNLKKLQVKKMSKINTNLTYRTGMLDICFDTLSFSNEELHKIISGFKKKVKYVLLNKNTIIDLMSENAKNLYSIVNEFDLDSKHLTEHQKVPLYQSLKLLTETFDFLNYTTDEVLAQMLHEIAHYKEYNYQLPKILENKLRDYQIDAFNWMKTLCKYNLCGILADDMGLGKTLEMISVILSDEKNMPSLIVCPKSLSFNWTNEFLKWNCGIRVININGSNFTRHSIIKQIKNDIKVVYISSYDSLKNDLEEYSNVNFRFMILDEAQFIKNHQTLKAKSVKQIKSELRFVLTGTPIENTVVDLWSIFDFLMPNYLYNYNNFKKEYEKEITINHNNQFIKILVKKITPFILRRTKDDVLKDLPEKIETIRFAEMNSDQRIVYEAELLKTKDILMSKNKIEVLSSLTRLREICVDPSLCFSDYNGSSTKIDLIMSMTEEFVNSKHKILIFSQFTSALNIIAKKFSDLNIAYFMLTGKTTAFERVEMAEKFNKTNDRSVFLISLKAGGTGLNLTGADIVIHLDPWWNVSAENQATDRAHRIGQKHVVQVIKIVCENSIEQKVIELQEIKRKIIDDVIANNDDNIVKLSEEDLKYLIS